jgi:hypothetical protein
MSHRDGDPVADALPGARVIALSGHRHPAMHAAPDDFARVAGGFREG